MDKIETILIQSLPHSIAIFKMITKLKNIIFNTISLNKDKHYLLTLFAVWLVIHGFLFWHYGTRNLFETSEYLLRADLIIKTHNFEDTTYIFYAIPILLVTIFKYLSPNHILPYLIFQCVLSGVATASLYYSGKRIFESTLAGFFSCVIFLVWLDNIHWNTTLMSESIMCSFILILLHKLVYFKGSFSNILGIAFWVILLCVTRPTGVILAASTVVFFLSYYWMVLSENPILKISLLTMLLFVAYTSAYFMFTNWDFTEQFKKGNIVTYADCIDKNDVLYSASLRMDVRNVKFDAEGNAPIIKIVYFIVNNPAYQIKSAGLKVWYLISGYRPYYSLLHNVYSMMWVTFVYMLCYFGLTIINNKAIRNFVVAAIIINCVLIGSASVDWDNRFYIPMEPGIVLLAGGGVAYLLKFIFKKNTLSINNNRYLNE